MEKDRSILNELQDLSPLLYQLKQQGHAHFRVPEDYFKDLEKEIFAYIDSGLADGIGRTESSFKIPGNYFESLPGEIMSKIGEADEEQDDRRVIDLQRSRRREAIPFRRWSAMAASIAIFILMGILAARFISNPGAPEPVITAEDISVDEAYRYLEENMVALDSEDIIAMIGSDEGAMAIGVADDLEEELHQYLNENIDDLEEYLFNSEI